MNNLNVLREQWDEMISRGTIPCFELELKDNIRDSIFRINQQCWAYFFRITPLKSKLTTKTYESFISQYQESKIDFTYDNIKRVSDIIMLSA